MPAKPKRVSERDGGVRRSNRSHLMMLDAVDDAINNETRTEKYFIEQTMIGMENVSKKDLEQHLDEIIFMFFVARLILSSSLLR